MKSALTVCLLVGVLLLPDLALAKGGRSSGGIGSGRSGVGSGSYGRSRGAIGSSRSSTRRDRSSSSRTAESSSTTGNRSSGNRSSSGSRSRWSRDRATVGRPETRSSNSGRRSTATPQREASTGRSYDRQRRTYRPGSRSEDTARTAEAAPARTSSSRRDALRVPERTASTSERSSERSSALGGATRNRYRPATERDHRNGRNPVGRRYESPNRVSTDRESPNRAATDTAAPGFRSVGRRSEGNAGRERTLRPSARGGISAPAPRGYRSGRSSYSRSGETASRHGFTGGRSSGSGIGTRGDRNAGRFGGAGPRGADRNSGVTASAQRGTGRRGGDEYRSASSRHGGRGNSYGYGRGAKSSRRSAACGWRPVGYCGYSSVSGGIASYGWSIGWSSGWGCSPGWGGGWSIGWSSGWSSCWGWNRGWSSCGWGWGWGWGGCWSGCRGCSRCWTAWPAGRVYRETVYVETAPIVIEREVPVVIESAPLAVEGAIVNTLDDPAPPETLPPEMEIPPLDPVTEAHLTAGSDAFATGKYADAADSFRMAVIKNPNLAAPKFAFGQALVGMGDYEYAAKVLRAALVQEPGVLGAEGSIVAVYRAPEDFYVVLSELKTALAKAPADPDLLFLVVYQYYFSGDPSAVPWFARLSKADPEDPTLDLLRPALIEKFPEFANFPPPERATQPTQK